VFLGHWLLKHLTLDSPPTWLLGHFDLEELLDERKLTSIHRIVLGMTTRDLKAEILEHPELVNIPDARGRTPLIWASCRGEVSFAKVLLSFNANPNQGDCDNTTPLHIAVVHGSAQIVELLLECGVDVNSKDSFGQTALHYCCR
jgi:ankyrin repeat protein